MPTTDLPKVVRFLAHFELRPAHVSPYRPRNWCAFPLRDGVHAWRVEAYGTEWRVQYNGGEIMLGPVNSHFYDRAVPTEQDRGRVNEATVACWCAMVMRGEPIDFGQRMTAEDQAILETCGEPQFC